jgi:hypothetical protein
MSFTIAAVLLLSAVPFLDADALILVVLTVFDFVAIDDIAKGKVLTRQYYCWIEVHASNNISSGSSGNSLDPEELQRLHDNL